MERYEAAYARQSVEKKDSLSIRAQLDLCRKASANDGIKTYQDRGYSGKNTDRPSFQRLLKDIRAGKVSKLYVYRLDRFSRSIADFGQLWNVLKEHDVEFVSVTENFDTSTPMGRAMLHIIMVFAQLERETTAERVKDNYATRVRTGAWPGGPAPYGYHNSRLRDTNGHPIPTLVPDEELIPIIMRIFSEYAAEDASLGDVVRSLNADGVPCAQRNFWDNVSVSRLLHNPVYVMADEQVRLYYKALGANVLSSESAFDGVHSALLYGKREANQRKYTNIRDQNVVMLNSVGVVPAELWLRCQEKLAYNAQVKNSGKGTHTWLSGLLKCGRCGYSLKVQTEKQYRWMVCSGRYNRAHCEAKISASLNELEMAIGAEIERLLAECPAEAPIPNKDAYEEKLAELDRRAERLMDAFAESDDMSSSYLKRGLAKLEKERELLLERRKREMARPKLPDKLEFAALGFDEKKAVAAQFIKRIEIDGDSVEVKWRV